MFLEFLKHCLFDLWVFAKLLKVDVLLAKFRCQSREVSRVGHHQGDGEVLAGVAVHAHVFNQGTCLQFSLHLAERNVLASLQFDQVLLAI